MTTQTERTEQQQQALMAQKLEAQTREVQALFATLTSPCQRVHAQPLGTATIRTHNADFQVEEVLGFTPEGTGEFLLLWIEKSGQNTDWVAGELAKQLRVSRRDVSYSGRKDRHAVTKQWFCIHWLNKPVPDFDALNRELTIEGCQVLAISQHPRKLRTGVHKANIFSLTLRDISADSSKVDARLAQIQTHGVANYYGEQRMGRGGANLHHVLKWQVTGNAPRQKNLRSLYLSSLRSALFNHALSKRVENQTWASCLTGEYLVLNGAKTGFTWQQKDEARGGDWQTRLQTGDIHPSIALLGKGDSKASQQALAFEQQAYHDFFACRDFLTKQNVKTMPRACRLMVENFTWHWHDAHTLQLDFRLVRGAFATTVLENVFELEMCVKNTVKK